MARPRKPVAEKRTQRIVVLVTDEEYARIEAVVRRSGLQLGPWLRQLALEATDEKLGPAASPATER